jgi:hypothetical protein
MRDIKHTLFSFSLACAVFMIVVPCYGKGKPDTSTGSPSVQGGNVQAGDFQNNLSGRKPVPRGGLVFVGVSGKLSKREDSVKAAVEDAARRLSFFYSVSGYSFKRERIGNEALDFNIDGFVSGVGFSGRLSSHRDTVVKSYERAVIAIIENMGSRVGGEHHTYQNTHSAFGFEMVSSNETSASGTLKNFYIIESWTDPANLSVWTLAVARGNDS